eukprot:gene32631-40264_t
MSPEDTTYRKALRLSVIAETIADMSGYSMAYKAVKYAYYSHELVNLLIKGGLSVLLLPLMESLKEYGITGPTAILRVYYLGCKHSLTHKINSNIPKSLAFITDSPGVLLPECPLKILQYISGFISPAQWLYVSCLPAPHNSNDWSSWYLSRIIRRQGWTVIMCINETTQLPNGVKCPAFALVTRRKRVRKTGDTDANSSTHTYLKEAMLVVRGSKSTMDWAINLEESLDDFTYTYKANCESVSSPGEGNVLTAVGKVHRGIHQGALGILDAFTVRTYLLRLLTKGYRITVVGHSLGAGVASLIAAEMRSTVSLSGVGAARRRRSYEEGTNKGAPIDLTGKPSAVDDSNDVNYHLAHNVSAVVFACPAIVSEPLVDAFSIDKLLINVVVGNDIIPRVSRKSFAQLAREVNDFTATANLWAGADKADFWRYMENMGKASDIHQINNNGAVVGGGAGVKADSTAVPSGEKPLEGTVCVEGKIISVTAPTVDSTAVETTASSSNPTTTSTTTSKLLDVTNSAVSGFFKYATTSSSTTASAPPAVDPSVPSAPPAAATTSGVVVQGVPSKPAKPDKPLRGVVVSSVNASSVSSASSNGNVTLAASATVVAARVVEPAAVITAESSSGVEVSTVVTGKLQIVDPEVFIITPSPIVHIYRENNGQMKSAVVTHAHASFTRIDLILDEVMEDHKMTAYRNMLTSAAYSLRRKERNMKAPTAAEKEASDLASVMTELIFNTTHLNEMTEGDSSCAFEPGSSTSDCVCTVDREEVVKQTIANADYIEGVDSAAVATALDPFISSDKITSSNGSSAIENDLTLTKAALAEGNKHQAVVTFGVDGLSSSGSVEGAAEASEGGDAAAYTHVWKHCYLCGLDVTWPYMLHSDASRATVTHNCSACGEVVCSACAPAGDQLPGDGYNQYYTLPDFRIALPRQGLFAPQRICLACYFDSSHATHEA